MMSKFKVGDRVRRTQDGPAKDEVGTVVKADEYGNVLVKFDTWRHGHDGVNLLGDVGKDHWLVIPEDLELIPAAEWQPKVGDRVRYEDSCVRGEGVIHSENADQNDAESFDWLVTVAEQDRQFAYYIGDTCRKFATSSLSPLPVAAEAQPVAKADAPKTAWVPAVGDKVRFVRDSTAGGARYGAKDATATVTLVFEDDGGDHAVVVKLDVDVENIGFTPSAYVRDLEPLSSPTNNVGAQVDTLSEEYGPARKVAPVAGNDNGASEAKFKVGDRVRIVRGRLSHKRAHVGDDFVIERETYKVNDEKTWSGSGAHGCVWLESELELITTTPTAIVALIEDGVPKPAERPFVHASAEAATKEAERLAGIHRGKQFGIFVLADTRETDEPAYDHAWKSLAARGEKIAAIKELRSITGMGLKPAKDAVEYFLAAA